MFLHNADTIAAAKLLQSCPTLCDPRGYHYIYFKENEDLVMFKKAVK